MNPDVFERNVERLVRKAALPVDGAAIERARARFVRAAGPASTARSRGLALIAASLLFGALVYGVSTSTAPPPRPEPREAQETPVAFTAVPLRGGNEWLKGTLQMSPGARSAAKQLRFEGRSPLPDGLVFQVRVLREEESYDGKGLVPSLREEFPKQVALANGDFDLDWQTPRQGRLRLEIAAPDRVQEADVLPSLKLREADRTWTFEAAAWDDRLLAQLEPQLAELASLATELADLVRRVDESCASMELFKPKEKGFAAEAAKLKARCDGFAAAGLYPAAARELSKVCNDLLGALPIFTWEGGRFDGPKSYYTNNRRGKTFRGDAFEFATLRGYLDAAVVVGGREFGLWILKDLARRGPRPELAETAARSASRPGVAPFAARLLGEAGPALEAEIRRMAKE